MIIAYIGQKGIPSSGGGVERHVEELANRLVARGHKVLAYSRFTYKAEQRRLAPGITVINLPGLPIKAWDTIFHTFLSTIDVLFRKVDVVNYQCLGPVFFSFLIRIFRPRVRVVFTHHGSEAKRSQWGVFARWAMHTGERIGMSLAHRVACVSAPLAKELMHDYGRDVATIPNGFSALEYDASTATDLVLPKYYLLAVARLIRSKGLEYLVEAFNEIADEFPEYELLIVGTPTHNSNIEPELRRLAAGNERVRLMGWQSSENLARIFANATVSVQPSEMEGMPITLLEAGSFNLPILASDIPEHIDIARDDALYFKSKDSKDLALKLREMLHDLPTWKVKGEHFALRTRTEFTWESVADKFEKLYTV